MSDELKRGASLSFEDGLLYIQVSGCGPSNGSGRISFKEDDLGWGVPMDHDWRYMRLPKSELEAIRDFLNEHLPADEKPEEASPREALR